MKNPLRIEDGRGSHLLPVWILILFESSTCCAVLFNGINTQSVDEQCKTYGGLIADPLNCNAYYNCSYTGNKLFDWPMKCPYPRLFNTITMACDHFGKVSCGTRRETKNYCAYSTYRCTRQCGPGCQWSAFNCEGKQDGINVDDMRPWTTSYVICYKERFVTRQWCPHDAEGGTQLFSPDLHGCVGMDRIPSTHGGVMPSCTGKADGFYPNEYGRCDRYTKCEWGQYIESVKCPTGEAYDERLKACTAIAGTMCLCANTGWNCDVASTLAKGTQIYVRM